MASSPPSDEHSPSSMPSPWHIMHFNNPFPGRLQEDLEHPTGIVASKGVSLSPQPLSSQASMGCSTTKVSKRRSRAVSKPPIRVLSADRSNFRDMVQKLTGIPTSPAMQGNRFQQLWGNNPSAIFKPMATRPSSQNEAAAAAAAHQGLPTLDTSSAYLLLNGSSQNSFMNNQISSNNNLAFLQSLQSPQAHMMGGGGGAFYSELGSYNPRSNGGGGLDLKSLFASQYDVSKGMSMYNEGVGEEGSPKMPADMESLHRIRQASDLESLFMANEKLDDFFPRMLHNVDSWLSDAIHTPTPKLELAHSA